VCLAHCAVVVTYDVSMKLARCRFIRDRATFAGHQQPLWDSWSEAVRSSFRVGADSVARSEGENDRVSWTVDSGACDGWEADTTAAGRVDCSVLLLVLVSATGWPEKLTTFLYALWCGGIFNDSFVTKFLLILTVNELWKSVIFDKVKAYKNGANFWRPSVQCAWRVWLLGKRQSYILTFRCFSGVSVVFAETISN